MKIVVAPGLFKGSLIAIEPVISLKKEQKNAAIIMDEEDYFTTDQGIIKIKEVLLKYLNRKILISEL